MDCCEKNSIYFAVNSICQKLNEVIERVNSLDTSGSGLDVIREQIAQLETDVNENTIALTKKYSAENPPPYPVTKVNNKTGAVTIDFQELVRNNGVQVKLMTAEEYNGASQQTWPAYYELGFRIVGVTNAGATKIDAFYLLKQDSDNHAPIPVTVQGGEVDPNLIAQVQKNTEAIGYINDEMPNKYSAGNPPPYPVTTVNNGTGKVKINSLFSRNNDTDCVIGYNGDYFSKLAYYKANEERIGDLQLSVNGAVRYPNVEVVNSSGSNSIPLIRKDMLYFREYRINYSNVDADVININYKFGDCVILSGDGNLPEGNDSGIMVTFTESNIPSTAHMVRSVHAGLLVGLAYHDPVEGKSTIRIQMKSIWNTNALTDAILLYNMYGDLTIYKVFNYVT